MDDDGKKKGCTKATKILVLLNNITTVIVNFGIIVSAIVTFVKVMINH